jgi:predicted ribosomally synthesized peptide with SipW-like signal peptide
MKKKLLITLSVVACALLLVVGSIAGTIAYMTSKTELVKNTFTSGNVAITLDETKVDLYGNPLVDDNGDLTGEKTMENQYKLIPGHTYTKDPTIHVAAGSEDCYLFVKVVNGLETILDDTTIAAQMAAKGWSLVDGQANVYKYDSKVAANANVVVFDNFTIKDNAVVSSYVTEQNADAVITVQAYAVQADGFDDAADAWAKAPCTWGV